MSNKIRVLTNISASQNVIVSGSTIISGSKLLATTSSFNNSSIATSSDGFYNMNSAIHGLDTGITTLKNDIKTAYNSIRAVLTGTLDSSGNKKINLTSTIPSGSLYFTTASLTSVGASLLIDTENDNAYKNDLASFQLFNSASYLWAEIDAPAATNDYYRLIVVNHGSLPVGGNVVGGGNGGENGGAGNGGENGGEENLFIIFAPITTPSGSVDDSVSDDHEGYYIYPDVSGSVTVVINDFSASTADGGIGFYIVPNNYTGSVTYNPDTDVIDSNNFARVVTLAGDVDNTSYTNPPENQLNEIVPGQQYTVVTPDLTSSIVNNGNTITITLPVGTGSSVYVDTYSNETPTTYNFNWSGGVYRNTDTNTVYVPTFVSGGYLVGGTAVGTNSTVITGAVTVSGTVRLNNNGFRSTALIKTPPTYDQNGRKLDQFFVRWYGGGDVTVLISNNFYDYPVNGSLLFREDGETGFYFKADGQFDTDTINYTQESWGLRSWGFSNFRQINTFFMSAVERQSYNVNNDFSINPITKHTSQSGQLGIWTPAGFENDSGAVILINGNDAFIEFWFTYI